jgi:hypothetical protein
VEEGEQAADGSDAPTRPARDRDTGALAAGRDDGPLAPAAPSSERSGMIGHILLAEDNPINQLVTRAMLEQQGAPPALRLQLRG